MENSNWSKSHFCTYVFLCVASSDDNITVSEITNIHDFLMRLDINFDDAKNIIKEVCTMLNNQSLEQRLDFIKNTKSSFYSSDEDLTPLMDEIENLILADNNIEKSEILMYNKIRKSLNFED